MTKSLALITTTGFILAGAYNVFGMLLFSQFFSNEILSTVDPEVFSWLGQVAVVLWGLAYWSVANSYQYVPFLVLLFAVEKLVYSVTWVHWMLEKQQTLPAIAADSLLTATFYSSYGIGDIVFCIFFTWVAVRLLRESVTSAQ